MAGKEIYSVCGMCTVRCPIQVEVRDNRAVFIQGNPHAPGIEKALCARGSARSCAGGWTYGIKRAAAWPCRNIS
jgi:anaerobic selenocysteine-containing dehydrogenase